MRRTPNHLIHCAIARLAYTGGQVHGAVLPHGPEIKSVALDVVDRVSARIRHDLRRDGCLQSSTETHLEPSDFLSPGKAVKRRWRACAVVHIHIAMDRQISEELGVRPTDNRLHHSIARLDPYVGEVDMHQSLQRVVRWKVTRGIGSVGDISGRKYLKTNRILNDRFRRIQILNLETQRARLLQKCRRTKVLGAIDRRIDLETEQHLRWIFHENIAKYRRTLCAVFGGRNHQRHENPIVLRIEGIRGPGL
jgi:hypothetical protein